MPSKNDYKPILIRFMSYRDNVAYPREHEFTADYFGQITPTEVARWMCSVAYGIAEPGPDDNPTGARSTSIEYNKKAISSFMPNKLMGWNRLANTGNPTKSAEVNDLIKKMKKKEVRKLGRRSQARRALNNEEYRRLVDLIRTSNDPKIKYGIVALVAFQFHLLGRVDDACQWTTEHLRSHNRFPIKH
jgi:hypothetical protein